MGEMATSLTDTITCGSTVGPGRAKARDEAMMMMDHSVMMGVAGKWAARKWHTPDADDDWAHDERVVLKSGLRSESGKVLPVLADYVQVTRPRARHRARHRRPCRLPHRSLALTAARHRPIPAPSPLPPHPRATRPALAGV